MMLARAIAALLLALATLTGSALQSRAQTGRVDGVVFDSLRMQPLAGAIVQLVQPPPSRHAYSATTDSLGRFSISGIRADTYISGFLHPLLDTLGVLAAYGSLTIADGDNAHLSLSIPGA
ncbi:MAG: carboxypeptidase-like regulatory domain-containing protein, partial [Gemmatimonadota bacterium]